jgi:hypothetical protein
MLFASNISLIYAVYKKVTHRNPVRVMPPYPNKGCVVTMLAFYNIPIQENAKKL